MPPDDSKADGFTGYGYEAEGPVRVARTVGIVWIYGGHTMGSEGAKAAERHQQDVPIPDELLANHKDREDMLGFTFGPDKKWTVKLIPRAERGW